MKKNRKTQKLGRLTGRCCEATYQGIQKWYVSVFEKLGWMVLAKDRGMTDKVTVYIHSVIQIEMAIQQKLKKTVDPDQKEDLVLMGKNIRVLLKHLKEDFSKEFPKV
jgi:predicted lipoprotein